MDGGLFTNLFEIRLPESLVVYSKAWNGSSIREISARLYPINVYGDSVSEKVFAYGNAEIDRDRYKKEGLSLDTVDTQENPQFAGRFAADAVAHFLQTRGFVLAQRPYTTYRRELVHVTEPLQKFYGSLEVYPSYSIQAMYLNFERNLKYLLIIAPRLRHEFVIPIERIANRVDCTGRFLKLTCPAECDVYACELHEWRGKIAGRYNGLVNNGFHCEYLGIQDGPRSHVTMSDARLDLDIPAQVCHLEASLSNIRYIFEGVYDRGKVNDLIGRIRMLSGDLLDSRRVNLEVGRKRFEDCQAFAQRLSQFEAYGSELEVASEPLRAIEGVPLPEQDYGFAVEEEDDEGFGDVPF